MKKEQIAKSVILISAFSMISKILGMFRESFLASKFGSNVTTDCYFMALSLITILNESSTRFLNTTLISTLTEAKRNHGKEGKNRTFSLILVFFLLFGLVTFSVIMAFAKPIAGFFAHGFSEEQIELTAQLIRVSCFSIFLSIMIGAFRGYLQSEKKFTESAITDLPYNFILIFYLCIFGARFGLYGLTVATLIATFSQVLIQLPSVRKIGYSFSKFTKREIYSLKTIIRMAPGIMFSAIVSDLNQLIDKSMASTLDEGVISSFNYAGKVRSLIIGILTSAVATVYFPILSESHASGDEKAFDSAIEKGSVFLMLISIPAAAGVFVLSELILKILFLRGSFDVNALGITSDILALYTISVPALALKPFYKNAFFAMKNSWIPMFNVIAAVLINVTFNLILIGPFKHSGLAMATSISTFATILLLLIELKHKRKGLSIRKISLNFLKILLSSIIMAAVVFFGYKAASIFNLTDSLISQIGSLAVLVVLGASIYFALVSLFRVDELDTAKKVVLSKLKRHHK